jgi:hypothetical protein
MNKGDAFELLAGEGVLRDGEWRERVLPAYTTEISDRVRGMLLGIAIGDALGNTSESMNPSERTAEYGTIRNYLPNRHAGGRAVGLPSDDSQLTFWTVEHLLETGRLDPAALMDRFATSQIYGIGRATGEAIDLYRQHGLDWNWIGARRAGNGALMRIAPVLLPHLREPTPELWLDAVLATAITHRDSAAIASSVAWVRVLWELLGADQVPEPSWWLDSFVLMVREVENPRPDIGPVAATGLASRAACRIGSNMGVKPSWPRQMSERRAATGIRERTCWRRFQASSMCWPGTRTAPKTQSFAQ